MPGGPAARLENRAGQRAQRPSVAAAKAGFQRDSRAGSQLWGRRPMWWQGGGRLERKRPAPHRVRRNRTPGPPFRSANWHRRPAVLASRRHAIGPVRRPRRGKAGFPVNDPSPSNGRKERRQGLRSAAGRGRCLLEKPGGR
eukprot:GHVL01004483.1.p2 GENE.GHVL01004483.1~~GHVL01004483.1.p2  ORF type:complete len:141 (+),score=11.82 GHVL01004483.1:404-826(+)